MGIVGADDVGAPEKNIVGRNISNSNGIINRDTGNISDPAIQKNKVRITNFINNGGKERKRWWKFNHQWTEWIMGL